jgi:FkbM family methyltransferase
MLVRFKLWAQRFLAWVISRIVGPHTQAVLAQSVDGLRLLVDPQDQGVGRQLRLYGQFQAQELARLKALVHASDRVLVVGAHVGAMALPLARRCAAVVAVEANPHTFALLQLNVKLNDVANCVALSLAANDETGTIKFLQSRTNSGGSKRAPLFRDNQYMHDGPTEITVRAERLDDALIGQQFDVILMDIEGSEVFALRGMPQLLQSCRCLVVEFLPHHLQRVAGLTVDDFLRAIPSHLVWLVVPSTGACVRATQAAATLQAMVTNGRGDDGLIFSTRAP